MTGPAFFGTTFRVSYFSQANQQAASSTSKWLDGARQALHSGDLQATRRFLDLALRENPNSFEAHLLLAQCEQQSGNTESAVAEFQVAAELKPDSFSAHYGLALALLRRGNRPGGEEELRRALEINPGSADANYNFGVLLLEEGKNAEALAILRLASQLGPNRPDLSFNLIRAAINSGQAALAREEIAKCEKRPFANFKWYLGIGSLLLDAGLLNDAIPLLAKAYRIQPASSEARVQLSRAYLASNQSAEVVLLLQAPQNAEESYLAASAYYQLAKYGEAEALSVECLNSQPRNPLYLLLRARIYQRRGDQKAALELLTRAAVLDPGLSEVFYSQAVSHYFLGEYQAVRASLDRAIALKPGVGRDLFLYGISLENENQNGDAVRYLKRAIELDSSNARYHFHLGATLLRMDEKEAARQELLKSIALQRDYAFPHYLLGKMMAHENDFAGARNELEIAVKCQPDLAAALYQLSRVYSALDERELAADTIARFKALREQQIQDDAVLKSEISSQL